MARSLSQALIRVSNPALFATISPPTTYTARLLTLRSHSTQSGNFYAVDPSLADADAEALMVQKMEDAIHGIIVRRSAPDWLPFRPGSSYWVPPQRGSYGMAEVLQKLANTLTEEEVMSLTTARGWPSSAYFVSHVSPRKGEVEVFSRNTSQSEDDEE
ncbi:hypothetical protein RJ639_034753 [Escallonia herrerae]|uniref:Uncharacterized protein n=1 Tax=Escallonia herrerae TaxID=1293975 RepID=A0AA89BCI9_9ASTE|nr:hypothetical protein RJ639_034753 [Escallonia herrerae]